MGNKDSKRGGITIYKYREEQKLEVRIEDETLWLTQDQMTLLFDKGVKTSSARKNLPASRKIKTLWRYFMNTKNFVKVALMLMVLLTSRFVFAQSAELDKEFYWTYEKSYATLKVVSPEPGLQLVVILYNRDKNIAKEIINKPLNTTREKFFAINLKYLEAGNYIVEVHLGKTWSKSLEMVVLHRKKTPK